jgi:hypothetical protein
MSDGGEAFLRYPTARLPELTDVELETYGDHWWALARQCYRDGNDVDRWRCADAATYAVLEQARRAGVVVHNPPPRSMSEADRSMERNMLLNSCAPDDGCGFPIHPGLQGLRYPSYGMHLEPLAERRAFEERMRDWVAIGASYGMSEEQGLAFSLYM